MLQKCSKNIEIHSATELKFLVS